MSDSKIYSLTSSILKVLAIFFVLNLFFVSIKLLGVFKEFGSGYGQELMVSLAHNPFIGLVIGILTTSIIQSSSTTTCIVVGLIASGTFGTDISSALVLAIPIVMGANIGTTITNTFVSIGHIGEKKEFERAFSAATVHDVFNVLCVIIFLPLQIATNFLGKSALFLATAFENIGGVKCVSPLKLLVKPQVSFIHSIYTNESVIFFTILFIFLFLSLIGLSYLIRKSSKVVLSFAIFSVIITLAVLAARVYSSFIFSRELAIFVLSLGLLFFSLYCLVKLIKSMIISKLEIFFHKFIFRTTATAFIFGILITGLVQSSSATTSLIVPLVGAGLLTVYQVFPYTVGANIGTTITAILAALSIGEISAIAIAFAHLLFNIFGTLIFLPLRKVPINIATWFGKISTKSKIIPFAFILISFFIIPLLFIFIFK